MQLNKDSRNIGIPASTYGENALIESAQKKSGLIASENEVIDCPFSSCQIRLNFIQIFYF